jgi:hypothetical protein
MVSLFSEIQKLEGDAIELVINTTKAYQPNTRGRSNAIVFYRKWVGQLLERSGLAARKQSLGIVGFWATSAD